MKALQWNACQRVLQSLCAVLLSCALLTTSPPAQAADDDVDFLQLASVLARDGNFDKAGDALKQVDPAQKDLDLVLYHTVRGLIALNTNQAAQAVEAFEAAITAGQTDTLIFLSMAQAQFGLERYADTVRTLDRGGAAFDGLPGVYLLRAQAQWLDGQRDAALGTLAAAQQRFPDQIQFMRRQLAFLMELGFFQAASELGRDYLARTEGKEEDYLAIGTALKRSKQFPEAIRFLEIARLKFPDSANVNKALAATYLDAGQPLAAAELMYRLALTQPALYAETAELFRRAGQHFRALSVNARIDDQSVKLKQRLGILLELGRYAEVRGMEDALTRTGLLADEDVRYALAYAQFKSGDFVASEVHLKKLSRPELFRKATELRKLMADCAEERWKCV